jgi:hypothetical protein
MRFGLVKEKKSGNFQYKFIKNLGERICILYIASYGLFEGNTLLMPNRFYNQNNDRIGKEMN